MIGARDSYDSYVPRTRQSWLSFQLVCGQKILQLHDLCRPMAVQSVVPLEQCRWGRIYPCEQLGEINGGFRGRQRLCIPSQAMVIVCGYDRCWRPYKFRHGFFVRLRILLSPCIIGKIGAYSRCDSEWWLIWPKPRNLFVNLTLNIWVDCQEGNSKTQRMGGSF